MPKPIYIICHFSVFTYVNFYLFLHFTSWILGNFVRGEPHGNGKLQWKNGEICKGEILGSICKGTKITGAGQESIGVYQWSFDHENHLFRYNGKFFLFLFPFLERSIYFGQSTNFLHLIFYFSKVAKKWKLPWIGLRVWEPSSNRTYPFKNTVKYKIIFKVQLLKAVFELTQHLALSHT